MIRRTIHIEGNDYLEYLRSARAARDEVIAAGHDPNDIEDPSSGAWDFGDLRLVWGTLPPKIKRYSCAEAAEVIEILTNFRGNR